MPPKKETLVLKFKRAKTTYVLMTSSITLASLQNELAAAINATGGVDTPKSEVHVSPESISLAVPQDKSSPYDNNWIRLDDKTLKALEFADNDIFAFAVGGEDFGVTEPVYEEVPELP